MTTRSGALLEVQQISVRFGGLAAVSEVSLSAKPGSITGLIGPNGAGKTTTFNVLCGLQATTAGRVHIDGVDVTDRSPHQRARLGLARTFQRLETFSLLSVRENVQAGAELRRRSTRRSQQVTALTEEIIDRLGLGDVADRRVDSLPTGRARLVEIGRALANDPRILLLDEPSSGLNEAETTELAAVLDELADEGLTVLMVEHDMSLVMGSCELIHVLDFGQIIASGSPVEIQRDEAVRTAYLGDQPDADSAVAGPSIAAADSPTGLSAAAAHAPAADSTVADHLAASAAPRAPRTSDDAAARHREAPILSVHEVSAGYGEFDVIDGVSFDVDAHQVFALLGPNGAGKSTVLRVIAGLLTPSAGHLALCGRPTTGVPAEQLARVGVCLVPEGRGVFPNLTVAENLWMASFTGTSREAIIEVAFDRFPRLAERRDQPAGTLSGGEQQMLAMARALACDPALLILDELSMGLAPIIVADLYEQVAQIAATGPAILVVEQFAHEVLGIADRAAIMLHGTVRSVGQPDEIADQLAAAYLSGVVGAP